MTENNVMFRVVKPDDAIQILEIHKEAIDEGTFVQIEEEFSETEKSKSQFINNLLNENNSNMFVAELDNVIIGWLFLKGYPLYRLSHVAMLGMAIRKEYRGQGVGTKLVEHAVRWAKSNDKLKRIALAVFATNEAAIKIYHKAGFEIEGIEKNEIRDNNGELINQITMGLVW